MNIRMRVRWIHRVNATAMIVLLLTGVLHTFPDLRRTLVGDYELLIADVHFWVGVLFATIPLLALGRLAHSLRDYWKLRLQRAARHRWKRFNMTASIAVCVLQAMAGLLIWSDNHVALPGTVLDGLFLLHQAGAWYLGLLLFPHLYFARKAIAMTLSKWWRALLSVGGRRSPELVPLD